MNASGNNPVPLPDGTPLDPDHEPMTTVTAADTRRRPRWIVPLAAGLALLLTAGGGGYAWWRHDTAVRQLARAQTDCAQQYDKASSAKAAYERLVSSTDIQTALAVTGTQVEDATVLAALKTGASAGLDRPVPCKQDATADELSDTATANRRIAAAYGNAGQDVRDQAEKVVEARDAKTLKDAQTRRDEKTAAAQKLLDTSKGKVADDKTRTELAKAIQTARDADTASQIDKTLASLDQASSKVSKSINEKTTADKKAEEAAKAAAAQQAQAQAQTQQSYTPAYTPTYTPQQPTPQTTPQQTTTPQTGGTVGIWGVNDCERWGSCAEDRPPQIIPSDVAG